MSMNRRSFLKYLTGLGLGALVGTSAKGSPANSAGKWPVDMTGWRRIKGYERFDGRSQPYPVKFNGVSYVPVSGVKP